MPLIRSFGLLMCVFLYASFGAWSQDVDPSIAEAAPVPEAPWSLFKSKEIASTNMKSFSKWTDMWRRSALPREEEALPDLTKEEHRCRGRFRFKCNREDWEEFIKTTQGHAPAIMLREVNRYMNRSPYIVDPVNWGIPDYWATPNEFFLKDGDCEDYAISKYVTLKRLGYDTSKMRLVILQDENLRVAHAVLAVEEGGDIYILDNQVDVVLSHSQILHYRPVYSLNEAGWWMHRANRFSR